MISALYKHEKVLSSSIQDRLTHGPDGHLREGGEGGGGGGGEGEGGGA